MIRAAVALLALAHGWAQEGWILAEVTAYCGGPCEKCETTGVTANGTKTSSRPYGIAGSPNLALGSIVFVPYGVGYLDESRPNARSFILDDRGGALRAEWKRSGITRLDLRYRTHAFAKEFGRKLVMVYVITEGK